VLNGKVLLRLVITRSSHVGDGATESTLVMASCPHRVLLVTMLSSHTGDNATELCRESATELSTVRVQHRSLRRRSQLSGHSYRLSECSHRLSRCHCQLSGCHHRPPTIRVQPSTVEVSQLIVRVPPPTTDHRKGSRYKRC
jgi:hypothetical protein